MIKKLAIILTALLLCSCGNNQTGKETENGQTIWEIRYDS